MASVPGVCDNPECGAVFGSHAIALGPETRVEMSGNKVGPCPLCGSMGSIPDGLYSTVGGTVTIVLDANYPMETLDKVFEVFAAGAEGTLGLEEVVRELEDDAPDAAEAIRRYAPKTPTELAAYLSLIISALTLARGTPSEIPPAKVEQLVEKAVAQAIEKTERHEAPRGVNVPTLRPRDHLAPRPGASGRKAKKHRRRR